MNKVLLQGRVGNAPEVKFSAKGTKLATFSVATTEGQGDKSETEWHNIVCFGQTADIAADFKKGDLVFVDGRNKTSSWDGEKGKQYRTEVVAWRVYRLAPASQRAT